LEFDGLIASAIRGLSAAKLVFTRSSSANIGAQSFSIAALIVANDEPPAADPPYDLS